MRLTRIVAVGVMVSTVALTVANAQIKQDKTVPAEFPPADYKGSQYVDSRGCIYIRAGFDGAVNWVPRMTRAREVICGAQPTPVSGTTTTAQAPRQRSQPVQIVPDEMPDGTRIVEQAEAVSAPAPAAAPAPQPQPIRRVTSAPAPRVVQSAQPRPVAQPVTTIASTATAAPRTGTYRAQPSVLVAPPPSPVAVPQANARIVQAQATGTGIYGGCQGATPLSTQYLQLRQPGSVRCGPQQIPPVGKNQLNRTPEGDLVPFFPGQRVLPGTPGVVYPGAPGTTIVPGAGGTYYYVPTVNSGLVPNAGGQPVIVPSHVYAQRADAYNVQIPEGYERVWTDGRLNPYRAAQSAQGIASTQMVWTNTVPRRLVDPSKRRNGVQPVVVGQGRLTAPEYDSVPMSLAAARQPVRMIISTRNAPRSAAKATARDVQPSVPVAPAERFVQAGAFTSDANARAAAMQLAARSSQPVRLGTWVRGNEQYRIVVLGPFTDDAEINRALGTARSAGYTGAYVR